jgi:hypothetical protein
LIKVVKILLYVKNSVSVFPLSPQLAYLGLHENGRRKKDLSFYILKRIIPLSTYVL